MKLLNLVVENFRCFDHVEFVFADQTVIRGSNGTGKSSIAEAIVWCLYGTNIHGKTKADTLLIRDASTEMRVLTIWETATGLTVTIERIKPVKGAVMVLVNGNRAMPGQIEGLFFDSVNEFLSVFIPGFFSSLEPKEAKAILARYSDVKTEDVVQRLAPQERKYLEGVQLGMGYDSLEVFRKKVTAELKELESERLRLEGNIRTFEGILANGRPECPVPTVRPEDAERAEKVRAQLSELEFQIQHREQTLKEWQREFEQKRATYKTMRSTLIRVADVCPTCEQTLAPDVKKAAEMKAQAHNGPIEKQMSELKRQGSELSVRIQKLKETPIPIPENLDKWRVFVTRVDQAMQADRDAKSRYEVELQNYEQAKANLDDRKGELAVLERDIYSCQQRLAAIKTFRQVYVRTQQRKLDGLFEKVKLSLSKLNEDGEIKDAFQIQWNGKPYQTLSRSERVRCDIELGRAIAALRDNPEPMPVFVDDAESVEDLFHEQFDGQVIAAYRFTSELTVQSREEASADLVAELQQMQALIGGVRVKRGA
ncbi:MAG: AAA family ATPase [Alicyclobacillus sp.]|nr:AAA family ATPase [Alicyclobacillus sp.]